MVDCEMVGHGADYQQHVWQQKDIHHQPLAQAPSPTIHTEVPAHYSASDAESDTDLDSSDGFEWLDQPEANIDGVEHTSSTSEIPTLMWAHHFFLDFLSDQPQAVTTANSAALLWIW